MDQISIRYGEDVTLGLDSGDITAVSANIYIGKPGEQYVISQNTPLVNGVGTFIITSTQTQVPLGTYYYQINITDSNGYTEKYPSPSAGCYDCEDEFPQFIISEALDEIEVS